MITNWITEPWPWYIAGPMITLVMYLMLYMGKSFGVSSTLRTFCSIAGAGKKIPFFNIDWKEQRWNLWFVLGGLIGGWIASTFLQGDQAYHISGSTITALQALHINVTPNSPAPEGIFSWDGLFSLRGFLAIVIGGFLVGFGTRYAGGCTSGHAISGLSNLQLPSFIAVVGFFIGGLICTHFLFPFIF